MLNRQQLKGLTTTVTGDLVYISGTSGSLAVLADVAVGQILVSGGVGTSPAWSATPIILTSLTVPSLQISGDNGTYREEKTVSELLTIAVAASSDTTMTIPANAVVYGVSVRVTTVIPTAATFTVIGATSGTAFQTAAVSTVVNSTDVGTGNCPYKNGAAQAIRITPNATPANNTGRVRITVHYYIISAAIS